MNNIPEHLQHQIDEECQPNLTYCEIHDEDHEGSCASCYEEDINDL